MNYEWMDSCLAIMRISGYDKFRLPWWFTPLCAFCIVLLAILWQVILMFIRWMKSPVKSPERLLGELMRIHQLNAADRKILQRMARVLPKNSGLYLFVDPNLWPLDAAEFQEIRSDQYRLYEKIFGFPPDRNLGT